MRPGALTVALNEGGSLGGVFSGGKWKRKGTVLALVFHQYSAGKQETGSNRGFGTYGM